MTNQSRKAKSPKKAKTPVVTAVSKRLHSVGSTNEGVSPKTGINPRQGGGVHAGESTPTTSSKKKNPGRTTDEDYEDRVIFTLLLLQKGWQKYRIKNAIKDAFSVDARTCENYLARAREVLQREFDAGFTEHMKKAFAILTGIMESNSSSNREKMMAIREFSRLFIPSGHHGRGGVVLNQQINVSSPGADSEISSEENESDATTGELHLDARRTRLSSLAERIRTRNLSDGTG